MNALADPVGHAGPGKLGFALDPAHEAHEPPEARGLPRDGVRLLVSRGDTEPVDSTFRDLARVLAPGAAQNPLPPVWRAANDWAKRPSPACCASSRR